MMIALAARKYVQAVSRITRSCQQHYKFIHLSQTARAQLRTRRFNESCCSANRYCVAASASATAAATRSAASAVTLHGI